MRIMTKTILTIVSIMALAAVCYADSLSDGRALYKAGNYSEAVTKLEQATKEAPNDAKAWWQLNFAYNKLGRYADALAAVKKAGQIDPQHSFASDPGKFQETLDRMQEKAGTPPSAPGGTRSSRNTVARTGSSPAGYGGDNITRALLTGNVFIAEGMKVDGARLEQAAESLKPAIVKFVVLNKNITGNQLVRDAEKIRTALNIGNGYVILGSKGGVAVSSKLLSKDTESRLVHQYAPMMAAGNYTEGLVGLASGLVVTKTTQVQRSNATWVIVLGGIALIIVLWVAIGAIRRSQAMAKLRRPIERQKGEVITRMSSLENQLSSLDSATAAKVREARATAGSRLDEAARILVNAKSEQDLNKAQHLLDQARADCERGQAAIERAAGGGAPAAATTAASQARTQPVTDAKTDWQTIPETERGVCFFCSRPSLMSELTPVTVNLGGEQQKVLACVEDLATIKTGQTPQIRAFNDNGRYVPWYASQNYDPYNDYYSRGYYNRSIVSDLIMWNMVDSMYWNWHNPVGWGWGGGYGHGYAFYSDHQYYNDYAVSHAASYGDFNQPQDAAGADFLQSSGGDFDSSSGDNLGGDQS